MKQEVRHITYQRHPVVIASNHVCKLVASFKFHFVEKEISPNCILTRVPVSHLLKALVCVDVVQALELVVVQHQGGRVEDQLRRGAAELLHPGPGQVQGVGV